MLWSSRKVLKTDKGLRCPILICNPGQPGYECLRPAKDYVQTVDRNGYHFDMGITRCCKSHKKVHEAAGITMTKIDRRRKVTAGAQGEHDA